MEGAPRQDEENRLNRFAREELDRRKKSKVLVTREEVEGQLSDERKNSHILISDPVIGSNQKTFRFWINRGPIDRGALGNRTLGHRHTVEAVIYIKQGHGYSVIDGVKYPWTAGDLICVPVFAWHLHFNELDVPLIHLAATTGPLSMYQGIAIYEDDRYPELWVYANQGDEAMRTLIPGGAERDRVVYDQSKWKPAPRANGGQPTSAELYYQTLDYAQEEEKRRRLSKVTVKPSDLEFGPTPMGRVAYAVDPRLGFHVKLLSTLVAEVPPGKHSGAHRHLYEETDYVMAGRGYAIVDDRRYDFKEGDTLIIPRFVWHQYFNTGDETIRFLVHTDRVALESTGYLHTQQAEPANYE
jgi:gentisate 1,2-dioxygenase